MPSINVKKRGDFYGQDDPVNAHLTEVRSFRDETGRTYFVYRYPSSRRNRYSYHTFVEVENKDAYEMFCGGKPIPKSPSSVPGWWDIWPEP